MASYALVLLLSCVVVALGAEQEKVVEKEEAEPDMPPPIHRALFKMNNKDNQNETKDTNETMQGDDARVHYIGRSPWSYYYRAPVHAVVNSEEESNQAYEESLRRHYYYTAQYPRSALVDYRSAYPYGYGHTLSESQLAWIHSQHPEVRDQYLKEYFGVRPNEVNYLTYPNAYQWASHTPYVRQAVAVASDPVSALDYSCHRTERDGRVVTIKAPKLPNATVHRYDRRQNPHHPHNDYLAAEYRCKAGYTLLDSRSHELYCSQSTWVGHRPVCVPVL